MESTITRINEITSFCSRRFGRKYVIARWSRDSRNEHCPAIHEGNPIRS